MGRTDRVPWAAVRFAAGVAVLAVLIWRLGGGPFLEGLRLIDARAVLAALGVGAVTVVACAWRWQLVARGLGLRLRLRTAVADCYRSLLLNATLPGGVLGDVHRAVGHGRDNGDVGRGVRAVVWERTAGQVVQAGVAVLIFSALPSPVRPVMPWVASALLVAGVGGLLVRRLRGQTPPGTTPGRLGLLRAELRAGLLDRRIWPGVLLASAVAVAGHLVTFVVAVRTVGLTAPLSQVVPLTLLALLAMGIPANVGGFGPREGVAAWAFGAAGLTAAQGVAAATVYGALVLVSSLPGVLMLLPHVRRHRLRENDA